MVRVKGIYDGEKVLLLEPLDLPVNSTVEVIVPETPVEQQEQSYWQYLLDMGLITEVSLRPIKPKSSRLLVISGKPVSETIIEERR